MFAVSDPTAATTTPFETLGESLLSQGSDDDVDNGGPFASLLHVMAGRAADQRPAPEGEAASLGLPDGSYPSAAPPIRDSAESVDTGPRSAPSATEGEPSALATAQELPQGPPLIPLEGEPWASPATQREPSAVPLAAAPPGVVSEGEPLPRSAAQGERVGLPAVAVPSAVRSGDDPARPLMAQQRPSPLPSAPVSRLALSPAEGRPTAPTAAPVTLAAAGETSALPGPPPEGLSRALTPGLVPPPFPGGAVAEGAPKAPQVHSGSTQQSPERLASIHASQPAADVDHRVDSRAAVLGTRVEPSSGFDLPESVSVEHPETGPTDVERQARGAAGGEEGQRTGSRTSLTAAKAYAIGMTAAGGPARSDSATVGPSVAPEPPSPIGLFQPRQSIAAQLLGDHPGSRESDGAKLSDLSHLADRGPIDAREANVPMFNVGEAPGNGGQAEPTLPLPGTLAPRAEISAEPLMPGVRSERLATAAVPVEAHDPSGRYLPTKPLEDGALSDSPVQDVEDQHPSRVVPARADVDSDADGGQHALPYWRARAFSKAFHGSDALPDRSLVLDAQAEPVPQTVRAAVMASSPLDMVATPGMSSGSNPVSVVVPPAEAVMGPTYLPELPADGGIGKQIVQAARLQWRDGVADARVSLRPEYLGDVTISLRVQDGGIEAVLHVDEPDVRAWVKANHVLLKEALAERGLTLERLVVSEEHPGGRNRRNGREPEREPRRHQRSWTNGGQEPVFEVVV